MKRWFAFVGLIAFTFLATASRVATSQWWLQVLLLGAFVWTLWRACVPAKSLATMFVISLVPEIVLGYWQFVAQSVNGMKWLGIATHLVQTPGTIVIEHGAERILRVYGGFPHPNIFGGWLAIGLLLSFWLLATETAKKRIRAWSAVSILFSVALFLTFSRAAWIAAVLGLAIWSYSRWRQRKDEPTSWRNTLIALTCCAVATITIAIPQRENLLTRVSSSERLETKSTDQRIGSLDDGVRLFRMHPFVGSGPNAELVELARVSSSADSAPFEPPHNAYLLASVDVGIVGMVLLVCLLLTILPVRRGGWSSGSTVPIIALGTLALFDHYLWSAWSGQVLVALVVLISLSQQKRTPEECSTA